MFESASWPCLSWQAERPTSPVNYYHGPRAINSSLINSFHNCPSKYQNRMKHFPTFSTLVFIRCLGQATFRGFDCRCYGQEGDTYYCGIVPSPWTRRFPALLPQIIVQSQNHLALAIRRPLTGCSGLGRVLPLGHFSQTTPPPANGNHVSIISFRLTASLGIAVYAAAASLPYIHTEQIDTQTNRLRCTHYPLNSVALTNKAHIFAPNGFH